MGMSAAKRFAEYDQVKVGIIGIVATALVVTFALNVGAIRNMVFGTRYTATFSESGGLKHNDEVRVAGVEVGKVRTVELHDTKVRVSFDVEGVRLGDQTHAAIKTDNALGRRFLSITPGGAGTVSDIPLARTTSPYGVTEALSDLTRNTQQLDTAQLTASFNVVAQTFAGTPSDLTAALNGVSSLSRTIASRDAALRTLLRRTAGLSDVLARRSKQIQAIAVDGDSLLTELQARRAVIGQLIRNTRAATTQLTGLVTDNDKTLKPALDQLRRTSRLLNANQKDLEFLLTHLGPFVRSLGEAVGGGPFFYAYVENLMPTSTFGNDLTVKLGQALSDAAKKPRAAPPTLEAGAR
jgi:phospholipid/cholesterol/gamma-HCH transport system substrate-binding protein